MDFEMYLIPKFEVIAKYPFSPFDVGQQVFLSEKTKSGIYYHKYTEKEPIHLEEDSHLLFPAIFKKLQWHEGFFDKMPEYLNYNGKIKKVKQYGHFKGGKSALFLDDTTEYLSNCKPATEQEFLNSQTVSTK